MLRSNVLCPRVVVVVVFFVFGVDPFDGPLVADGRVPEPALAMGVGPPDDVELDGVGVERDRLGFDEVGSDELKDDLDGTDRDGVMATLTFGGRVLEGGVAT